jgi:DNA polymerase-3 subunit epsilon
MFRNLRLTRPLSIFDLETDSADPATARIVELAVTTVCPDGKSSSLRKRFNPGVPIPADATRVHGITDADVRDEMAFRDFAPTVADLFGDNDLAGYGLARFDIRVLSEEMKRANVPFSLDGRAIIDAYVLYSKLRPRTLSACVKEWLGREHVGAHAADNDVRATIECLDAMLSNEQPDDGTGLMPNTVPALVEYLKDPSVVDAGGFFTKAHDGVILLKIGKHRGSDLASVAKRHPDYLRWVIDNCVFGDTKRIAAEALDAAAGPRLC